MLTVSIITATFNSSATLRDCIESVINQRNVAEHIIIDGGSTDGTIDIAKSYRHNSRIISEPDNGIYDAMNKGISLATGDVIGILNSDDFYANRYVLEKVRKVFAEQSVDSCYGDLLYVAPDDTRKVTRYWRSGKCDDSSFYWGWMPPHPTFFVRRDIYEKYGIFNLNLGSAADYELMLRFLVKFKITTTYIPEVLVNMRAGGVSNVSIINRIRANRMDRKAWEVNSLRPYPWTIYLKPIRKICQFFS